MGTGSSKSASLPSNVRDYNAQAGPMPEPVKDALKRRSKKKREMDKAGAGDIVKGIENLTENDSIDEFLKKIKNWRIRKLAKEYVDALNALEEAGNPPNLRI